MIDVEIGNIENEKIEDLVDAVRVDDPKKIESVGDEDVDAYKKAWNDIDIGALEGLRLKHPEDARFSLHLSIADLSGEDLQEFSEVNTNHKALVDDLGLSGANQFIRLLEAGNKKKLEDYVNGLPKSNPLRKNMLILLKYV